MQFLVVKQTCTADIYGHTYTLNAIDSPESGLNDILVVDDYSAFELTNKHQGVLATASFDSDKIKGFPAPLRNLAEIPPNSSIIILRSGGIGDQIMLTPALKALHEKLSDRAPTLSLSVQEDRFPIFRGLPYIDQLFPLPLPMSDFLKADYYADFSDKGAKAAMPDDHMIDIHMKLMGLDPSSHNNKLPTVSQKLVTSSRIIELFHQIIKTFPKRLLVLLNWFASTHVKSLPPSMFASLTREFPEIVFLVAHPRSDHAKTDADLEKNQINAVNISNYMKSLYDYFTAIHLSDAVICSDTSVYHIASIYQKPSIVIIGPTYPILTSYYPKCSYVNASYKGKNCASPCGRTRESCPEAIESDEPYSPCLLSIPQYVMHEAFRKLLSAWLTIS